MTRFSASALPALTLALVGIGPSGCATPAQKPTTPTATTTTTAAAPTAQCATLGDHWEATLVIESVGEGPVGIISLRPTDDYPSLTIDGEQMLIGGGLDFHGAFEREGAPPRWLQGNDARFRAKPNPGVDEGSITVNVSCEGQKAVTIAVPWPKEPKVGDTLALSVKTVNTGPAAPKTATTDKAPADTSGDIVVERVVAVVDNAVVLSSELESVVEALMKAQPLQDGVDKAAAMAERRAQVLDTLIAEKLLEAEVRKLRIDVTAAEVERIVASTKAENNLTDESFKIALGRQGMTIDEYKEQLKKQLTKMKIVQLKVKNRVNVSDAEVKTAQMQKAKAAQVLGFTKVRARHILWLAPASASQEEIDAQKKKAIVARGRLEGGADFTEMAASESEDPGSKSRGGDLGAFGRGEMVPEFERAAFEAPVGKVVGPVRSPFGWHLIIVDERVSPVEGDATGAIEALREQMYQKETEIQFMQYIDELRREAFIEKRL